MDFDTLSTFEEELLKIPINNATQFSFEKTIITAGYHEECFFVQNEEPRIKPENF